MTSSVYSGASVAERSSSAAGPALSMTGEQSVSRPRTEKTAASGPVGCNPPGRHGQPSIHKNQESWFLAAPC
jgi:hypothetical protein